ncbi:MAG: class I SAM-dependent methyltransferase [Phycisphaeraceae bacterium]
MNNTLSTVSPATFPGPYRCPRTGSELRVGEGALHSAREGHSYPLIGTIPDFLAFDSRESEDERQQLVQLNDIARQKGWQAAVAELHGEHSSMYRYVTDAKRSCVLDILPLKATASILEVGPGLGQMTVPLAQRVKSVHVLEVVPGQAEFVQTRCEQVGLDNVHAAVGGDDCRLPYADASFQGVLLNLVFEWCGTRCMSEPHIASQRRLLQEASRVTAPGGFLFLNTKNRYAIHYCIGKPDEHVHDMRFGYALPRPIMDIALRLSSRPRPAGCLHSYFKLRRLLRGAGFGDTKFFWAAPEMRFPERLVPADARSVRAARRSDTFIQGDTRSASTLMPWIPAPLVKLFTRGLTVLATKPR